MKPAIITCDDGHGRILSIGHVRCRNEDCQRLWKHQPSCCSCGGALFEPGCAHCYASQERSGAVAVDMLGEIGSAGYAD